VEFFTGNIENPHMRRAYARACGRFFVWCERRGLTLATIRPFDVAAWVQELREEHSTPGVKQQLAAVRMLFDWLITGQVVPTNPAASVRGPKYVVTTGKTPVLDGREWRKLLDAIPADIVRDLRDRALIATLTYSFARIGAALKLKVEDLRASGTGWQIHLHEKGGKEHRMPCHHALAEMLHAYIAAAGIAAPIGNHSFRATGITNFLENGGSLENAQDMAAHASPRTTRLYDRRRDRLKQAEVERIRLKPFRNTARLPSLVGCNCHFSKPTTVNCQSGLQRPTHPVDLGRRGRFS
jgi:site-specific recombinase XerD